MFSIRVRRLLAGVLLLAVAGSVQAQTVELIAGGRLVDDFPALEGPLTPHSISVAPDGAIYIIDSQSHRALVRDPANGKLFTMPVGVTRPLPSAWSWVTHLFFGPNGAAYQASGNSLYQLNRSTGGLTLIAQLASWPFGPCAAGGAYAFAVDNTGSIYFTDNSNHSLCKIVNGQPQRIAGTTEGFSGDGGSYPLAQFRWPMGIAIDAANNIYIADQGNNRVRKITASTGIITTIAGNGQTGKAGENIIAANSIVNAPTEMTFDATGNLFFNESGNFRVRRIDAQTARVSTVVGTGSQGTSGPTDGTPGTQLSIASISGVAIHPNGDLLVGDGGRNRVFQVSRTTGLVSTVAGNGTSYFCGDSTPALKACLHYTRGIALDPNGDVYIAELNNRRVRKFSPTTGLVTTIAGRSGPPGQYQGEGGPASDVNFGEGPTAVALDAAGNLFVGGGGARRLYRIDRNSGVLTTIAGTGQYGFSGDGGPAVAARTTAIDSVAVDSAGNVYFADTFNNRIRRVAADTGIITTIAGTGVSNGPLGDGGPATAAALNWPRNLAFDRAGNLLFVDYSNNRIRKIDRSTGIITTYAGNGSFGGSGDGGPASVASINHYSFALDAADNIFMINGTMRWIEASTGIIRTIPGVPHFSPEGFSINTYDLAIDRNGRLYDSTGEVILRITGLPTAQPDSTPPVITPTVTGALGNAGWYTGDVQVGWSVTDAESPIVSQPGCSASTVSQDTAGITFNCTATSGGGSSSASVTLKRDATPPTVTVGPLQPEPDARGWNNSDVMLPYSISDNLSGVVPVNTPNPLVFTNEGMYFVSRTTVSDVAGNTALLEFPAVQIDKTPPMVSPDVTGTPGAHGWYLGNLQVAWNVSEIPESVASTNGCDPVAITYDTAGATFTCTVTSAGGSTSSSVTVKLDATAPTLTFGAPAPAANAFGWHNYDVSLPFSASDATSGVASTSTQSPLVFANEGVGLRRTVTVIDEAGNTASFESAPLNIDKTSPLVSFTIDGPLGNNGWYRGDATVHWSINEMPDSVREIIGCENATVTEDTGGVMFGCVVNSGGGGMGVPAWVKRDATAPVVTFSAPSPAPNANGWNKANVTVGFTRSDALSGIASTSTTSPLRFNSEGANQTREVTVTDLAGNTATFANPAVNIDKTAPYAEMESPVDSATYGFYANVPADFVCEDLAIDTCTAPVAQGAFINTTTSGSKTFKVTATNKAGLVTTHTHTYNVRSSFDFSGFLSPLRAPSTLNVVTRGSLVPLRWRLPDGRGGFVTNPASFVSATVSTFTCSGSSVTLNDVATGGQGLNFDAASGTFTYNWQTDAGWTGCRKLVIKLKDNSTHEARFRFQ